MHEEKTLQASTDVVMASRPAAPKWLKARAADVGVFTVGVALVSQAVTGDPFNAPELGFGYLTNRSCDDPSSQERARVFDNMRRTKQIKISDIPGATLNEYADQVAEDSGLTLVDGKTRRL